MFCFDEMATVGVTSSAKSHPMMNSISFEGLKAVLQCGDVEIADSFGRWS